MDLDRMKYGELQKLAKSVGIKANVKIDKLVKALKEYYAKQKEVQHFQKAGQDENGTEKFSSSEEDLKQSAATELDKKENAQTISTRRKKGKKREKDPGNTKSVNISNSYPAGEPLSKRKRHSTFELEKSTLGSPATPDIDHTMRKNAPGSSTTVLNQNRKIMTPRFMSPGVRGCKEMGSKCATPRIVPQTKNSQNVSAREQAKGKGQNPTGSHSGEGKKKNQINSSPGPAPRTPSEMIEVTPVLRPSLELDCKKTGNDTSPGTQKIMDTISGEMSSAERREKLMNAIDMKIEEKYKNTPQKTPPTQIPRFVAFLEQRKQEQKKPITPGNKDWQKVHKKEFSKFDSIDVYLEKKRKRTEELSGSVKRTCTVLNEVQEVVTRLKNSRTPSQDKKQALHAFRPTVVSTKDMNLNFVGSPMKKIHTDNAQGVISFQPTVISTKDMNLNFASFKTPVKNAAVKHVSTGPASARKSLGVSAVKMTSARKSLGASAVKMTSARKSLGASAVRIKSPFKFTASFNTSEVTSASKPKFDLKASLARPMTWKPHTGKLKALEIKPYGDNGAEFTNNGLDKSVSKRMELYKTHTSHKKVERRALVTANRTLRKDGLQMKKRGISAKQ